MICGNGTAAGRHGWPGPDLRDSHIDPARRVPAPPGPDPAETPASGVTDWHATGGRSGVSVSRGVSESDQPTGRADSDSRAASAAGD